MDDRNIMLIKQADDKSNDIKILQDLLSHPQANSETKQKVERELRLMNAGLKGEREAAYEIDFQYRDSDKWAVIHDLRIQHKGQVAQIDHILLNRVLGVWVCESKHFSEGVGINEHGEFSAFYNGKPFGVPSPIEQNRKHCQLLQELFDDGAIELPRRLGITIKPTIRSLILVSKNSRISRPTAAIEGLDCIVKVDQAVSKISKDFERDFSPLSIGKIIGADTLESIAKALLNLHNPIQFDWHARFGLPKQASAVIAEAVAAETPVVSEEAASVSEENAEPKAKVSKLVCHSCAAGVSYAVAKFCWGNKKRFGGDVYCMECQKGR